MAISRSFNGNLPITWIKRIPVYLATIATALLAAGCVLTSILLASNIDLNPLALSWHGLASGKVWQPLTHSFLSRPDFFTLFGLFFYYTSAVEIEKFFGRKGYAWLFVLMAAVVPLVLLLGWRAFGIPAGFVGWYALMIGTFIAFATLYPNTEVFGWIPLKYMAFAGFVLALMSYLPERNWVMISSIFAQSAAGFLFVRFARGTWSLPFRLPRITFPWSHPHLRVVRTAPDRKAEASASLDAILDKISAQGMGSLTAKERAILENARSTMIKDDTE